MSKEPTIELTLKIDPEKRKLMVKSINKTIDEFNELSKGFEACTEYLKKMLDVTENLKGFSKDIGSPFKLERVKQ